MTRAAPADAWPFRDHLTVAQADRRERELDRGRALIEALQKIARGKPHGGPLAGNTARQIAREALVAVGKGKW